MNRAKMLLLLLLLPRAKLLLRLVWPSVAIYEVICSIHIRDLA